MTANVDAHCGAKLRQQRQRGRETSFVGDHPSDLVRAFGILDKRSVKTRKIVGMRQGAGQRYYRNHSGLIHVRIEPVNPRSKDPAPGPKF
jgi:hypothetical protein